MKFRRKIVFVVIGFSALLLITKRKLEFSFSEATASQIFVNTVIDSKNHQYSPFKRATSPRQAIEDVLPKNPELEVTLTADQVALMCSLKSLRSTVPLKGNVQVFASRMTPFFGNENTNVAWIKSPDCPDGKYSILHFSEEGEISKEIDCRKTDFTELSVMSGEQGNVDEVLSNDTEFNMAISGNGYFVLQCPDSHILLTRDGRFSRADSGHLKNSEGCTLVNSKGSPFDSSGLSTTGCNSKEECVGTLDPAFDEVAGLEYESSYSFKANSAIFPDESVTKIGPKILRPTFFLNALENIRSSERGVTSVSWSNHPFVELESLSCPQ